MKNIKQLCYINGKFPTYSFNLYSYWNSFIYKIFKIIKYLKKQNGRILFELYEEVEK